MKKHIFEWLDHSGNSTCGSNRLFLNGQNTRYEFFIDKVSGRYHSPTIHEFPKDGEYDIEIIRYDLISAYCRTHTVPPI